ncbi:MAG: iron-sulfur cluster biosynthesis family protein [Nocardioidaceae bacterium]
MLALTENAASIIRDLASSTETPATSGVRIAAEQDQDKLSLAVAPEATQGDEVLEQQGARVYLEQEAATLLQDTTLDAVVDNEGGVQFTVAADDSNAQ